VLRLPGLPGCLGLRRLRQTARLLCMRLPSLRLIRRTHLTLTCLRSTQRGWLLASALLR